MSSATGTRVLRIGARTSPLARAQVELVAGLLAARGVPSSFVGVTTRGDVDQRALTEIGGTGVFAGAVRDALRHGEIDVAVHSLKDLPTAPDPDLEVVAVPEREDTRDVLVGRRLADLDDGARVGTGAPRRAVQLEDWAAREGRRVVVVAVRGNVDTRLGLVRSGQVDAVVLAAAGLRRLGYLEFDEVAENSDTVVTNAVVKDLPAEILPLSLMLPAPGQGALALEVAHALPAPGRAA
ncbi:hydroxymethylbilane synthase [Microlunatus capsulatus]|uniref:hydroxymethylbilane synthase n=1 Tax=Microlunatus capsulatus TaxID=99117 RepID=UPI0031E1406A